MGIERSGPEQVSPIGRVLARLAKHVEQGAADVELSLPQYRLLGHLAEVDTAAASALAGRLEVSRPSVTALIDGLEARGLVERRGCATDRRRVELRLTAAGARTLRAADRAVEARLERLGDHLGPDERAEAHAGLAAWGSALNRAREARLDEARSGSARQVRAPQ